MLTSLPNQDRWWESQSIFDGSMEKMKLGSCVLGQIKEIDIFLGVRYVNVMCTCLVRSICTSKTSISIVRWTLLVLMRNHIFVQFWKSCLICIAVGVHILIRIPLRFFVWWHENTEIYKHDSRKTFSGIVDKKYITT